MLDAYKIAVRISLIENVTRGLSALGTHFTRANIQADQLNTRLKDIGKSALLGGGMFALGGAGLKLLQGPLEEAKHYETEIARIQALGFGDSVVREADKVARGLKIAGSSARDNAKTLREALAIMGNLAHAKAVLPTLTKMRIGIEKVMGEGRGQAFESMFQAAIKTAELRGALVNRETGQIDIQRLIDVLNKMMQAYVASGTLVKPTDYLQAIKTGGVSTKLMDDEMFFFGLGHYMQESGGSRIGTAAMSMFQNWAMGRMSQQVAENMKRYGLLDAQHIHYGKTGHITKVDPMGVVKAQEFVANPFRWINEVLVPKLKAQGIQGNDLNIKVAQLLGIRTAQNLADQMIREQKVTEQYIERAKKAANIDTLYATGQNTLAGKEKNYEAAASNLKLELGKNILPIVTLGLEKLNKALEWTAKEAQQHPLLTKFAVGMLAVTSAALVLGGSMLLFKAAFSGLALLSPRAVFGVMAGSFKWIGTVLVWLVRVLLIVGRVLLGPVGLALTAIAAAAWLIIRNWDVVGPYIKKIWEFIKNLFKTYFGWIAEDVKNTWEVIKAVFKVCVEWVAGKIQWLKDIIRPTIEQAMHWWGIASKAVSHFAQGLYESITGWIGQLWNWLKHSPVGRFIGGMVDDVKDKVSSLYGWMGQTQQRTLDWAAATNNRPWAFEMERRLNPTAMAKNNTVTPAKADRPASASASPLLPPPGRTQTIQVHSVIKVKDQTIAKAVTTHQARMANRPNTGASGFDPTMGVLPIGMKGTQ